MDNVQDLESFLKDSLAIDPLQLQDAYAEAASKQAFWNEKCAEAFRGHLHAEIRRKRVYASLYLEKRQILQNSKERATEALIDACIESDPRFAQARDEEADAHAEYIRLRGLADAIKTKKDMLVSLGAHVRAEINGDPLIRGQHANANLNTDF